MKVVVLAVAVAVEVEVVDICAVRHFAATQIVHDTVELAEDVTLCTPLGANVDSCASGVGL